MKPSTTYIVLWLVASAIAMFLALQLNSAAFVDGQYIPAGNDSFYHARRIIDAAIGERGFYQFDDMIHVPEGSWLNWPWAYDYLAAMALTFALWLRPTLEPMAFLAHVPVAWLLVNMGLLSLIARKIALSIEMSAVALLGFALLPLTQTLHGVGVIDHHFIELTFVLATLWSGLNFFSAQCRPKDVVILGVILGIAPAFHNGLFILQIPVLICFLAHWLRGQMPETRKLYLLTAALFGSTLLVVLPSAAFRDMQFEFWTLSWFHLYIAGCSAVGILFFGLREFGRLSVGMLLGLGVALVVPIIAKVMIGAAFLGGDLILLNEILEVKSPFARIREPDGLVWVTSYYSWMIVLAPVLIVVYARQAWLESNSDKIFFSVFVVFGVALMLVQYRLNPFGAWALLLATLLIVQDAGEKNGFSKLAITAGSLLVIAVAFQPPLKNRLFAAYPPGLSRDYAATRILFSSMAESCAKDGGTALSYNDDGHYIRYHTDCSVMTNNFLLTPQHERLILEADALLQLDPEQFLLAAPNVDYIFVRMYEIFEAGPNGMQATPIPSLVGRNAPLFVALTFADELPQEYQLIDEVRVQDERDFAYARVFKINR